VRALRLESSVYFTLSGPVLDGRETRDSHMYLSHCEPPGVGGVKGRHNVTPARLGAVACGAGRWALPLPLGAGARARTSNAQRTTTVNGCWCFSITKLTYAKKNQKRFNWFESTPRNAPRLPIQTNNHTTSEPHTHVMSNENKFPLKNINFLKTSIS